MIVEWYRAGVVGAYHASVRLPGNTSLRQTVGVVVGHRGAPPGREYDWSARVGRYTYDGYAATEAEARRAVERLVTPTLECRV